MLDQSNTKLAVLDSDMRSKGMRNVDVRSKGMRNSDVRSKGMCKVDVRCTNMLFNLLNMVNKLEMSFTNLQFKALFTLFFIVQNKV